ncbi:MAG: HAD hydrolase family protein [Candidatus Aquicultorales bacterium]
MPDLKSMPSVEAEELAEKTKRLSPDPKVLYSDVDGTLLGPGGCLFLDARKQLTLTPARAIVACHLHNLDVVLVSGRRHLQLFGDARVFGFNNWIAELGCQIVYDKGALCVDNIGDFSASGGSVYDVIEKSGAPSSLLDRYAGSFEYHTPWHADRSYTHVFRGLIDVGEANEFLEANGYGTLKLVDNGRVHRASPGLSLKLPEIHAYHLMPRASGKASAARKDREIRNLSKENTAAIGDSESDLELADEVGVFFLVANAAYENEGLLKKAAAKANVVVTKEAMGLGWAEAVGYLTGFPVP